MKKIINEETIESIGHSTVISWMNEVSELKKMCDDTELDIENLENSKQRIIYEIQKNRERLNSLQRAFVEAWAKKPDIEVNNNFNNFNNIKIK